jgi:hypothetical protein
MLPNEIYNACLNHRVPLDFAYAQLQGLPYRKHRPAHFPDRSTTNDEFWKNLDQKLLVEKTFQDLETVFPETGAAYTKDALVFYLYYYLKAGFPTRNYTNDIEAGEPTLPSKVNAARFAINRGWFAHTPALLSFLSQGPPPIPEYLFHKNAPIHIHPNTLLPKKRSRAFIHGKFMPWPHPHHEESIQALKAVAQALAGGAIELLVGVDQRVWSPWTEKDQLSWLFKASLIAHIAHVDAVIQTAPETIPPSHLDEYYSSLYQELKIDYLFVEANPSYNPLAQKQHDRAQKSGLTPIPFFRSDDRISQSDLAEKAIETRNPNEQIFSTQDFIQRVKVSYNLDLPSIEAAFGY